MAFRSILMGAVVLVALGVPEAGAQFPPPNATMVPPSGSSPFPSPNTTAVPPSGPGGFGAPPRGGGFAQPQSDQPPPCIKQFMSLREEREKRMAAAQNTMSKKPTADAACQVLTKLAQSEGALVKYVSQQPPGSCPFPPDLLDNIKGSFSRTDGYRKQACAAAATPKATKPAEPTLSDAFSAPTIGKENTKTGRGTLDSLYGNPLAR